MAPTAPVPAAVRSRRAALRSVSVLGFVLLIVLLTLGEIVPRLFELPESLARQRTVQGGMAQLDDVAGYVLRPFYRGRVSMLDFDEPFETNSRGLRGPELGPKQPGEFRIVVLGDSEIFGLGVRPEQRLTEQLEEILRGRGFASVHVVNVATPGWTTFNEAGYLAANGTWLTPDLVIVAVYLGNDIEENVLATVGGYEQIDTGIGIGWSRRARELVGNSVEWFAHNFAVGAAEYAQPHLEPNEHREAEPLPTPVGNIATASNGSAETAQSSPEYQPSSPADAARTWLRQRSRLYLGVADGWFAVRHGHRRPEVLNLDQWLVFTLRDQPPQRWLQLGYPLTERYLQQAQATAAALGARTVAVLIPHDAQVAETKRRAELGRFLLSEQEVDLERPQRELQTRAQRQGIPVIDLSPAFRTLPDPASLTFPHDLHLTPRGHAAVADILATELVRLGTLPTP